MVCHGTWITIRPPFHTRPVLSLCFIFWIFLALLDKSVAWKGLLHNHEIDAQLPLSPHQPPNTSRIGIWGRWTGNDNKQADADLQRMHATTPRCLTHPPPCKSVELINWLNDELVSNYYYKSINALTDRLIHYIISWVPIRAVLTIRFMNLCVHSLMKLAIA